MRIAPLRYGGIFEFLRENVNYRGVLERFTEVNGNRAFCPIQEQSSGSPAFQLYDDGAAHCFSCQFHGDVTKFWQTIKGLATPWDAAQDLAREFNLTLPTMDPEARARYEKRRQKEESHAKVAADRHEALKTDKGQAVREYLLGRGLGEELQARFLLGVTPKGHLNIPFWVGSQIHGQVIRRLDGQPPKYKAPTNEEFPLGRRPLCMTGGPRAIEYLLVEGFMDQLAAEALGMPGIGSGGAAPSEEQIKDLRSIGEKGASFFIVPDDDEAGHKAAAKTVDDLYPYAFLTDPIPGDGIKDMADLYQQNPENAKEILEDLMAGAKDALDLAMGEMADKKGRKKALYLKERIIPLILRLPTESERQAVITDVAKESGLSKEIIGRARAEVEGSQFIEQETPEDLPESEWADLLAPGVLDRYVEDAARVKGAVGDMSPVKLIKLSEASAQLGLYPNGKPMGASVMLTGQGGVGKNFAVDIAVALSPDEWYLGFEVASAQAFYYAAKVSPDFLKHKFLYPNEVEAVDTVVEFLRPMLSQAKARKYVTNKDGNGSFVFETFDVEGPITGVIPTVRNKLDGQLQTRLTVVELTKQKGQIADYTEALSGQLSPNAQIVGTDDLKLRWQSALRSLTGVRRVVADFVELGNFRLENEDIDHGARLWGNLLGLMCAHAWLEQRNREIRRLEGGAEAVVATPEDYKAAYELFEAVAYRSVKPIGVNHRKILQAVHELRGESAFPEDGFSQREIAKKAGLGQSTVSNSKSFLTMSVGLLYETDKKKLAMPESIGPADWDSSDPMKGFPTPADVMRWGDPEGPPPSPLGPRKSANQRITLRKAA